VSVNPEYDSPAVLKKYANKYGAVHANWHFLTGAREKIKELAVESFKVGDIKDPIFHSAKFILVDRDNQIRGYYEGTETDEVKVLFKDIALLLKEK